MPREIAANDIEFGGSGCEWEQSKNLNSYFLTLSGWTSRGRVRDVQSRGMQLAMPDARVWKVVGCPLRSPNVRWGGGVK